MTRGTPLPYTAGLVSLVPAGAEGRTDRRRRVVDGRLSPASQHRLRQQGGLAVALPLE